MPKRMPFANESFMVPWIALMIAHQSPRLDQPAKGSLHDPAPGQQDKTFGGVTTLDDREDLSAGVPEQSACHLCHLSQSSQSAAMAAASCAYMGMNRARRQTIRTSFLMALHSGGNWREQCRPCVEIVAYLSGLARKLCMMKFHHLVLACLMSLPVLAKELSVGDSVPDCTLLDSNGKPLRLSDFRGRALAMTFIFTRCPLADYCPRLSAHFKAAQQELMKAGGDNWKLLTLSFDPKHDTPAQLALYAEAHGADTARWTFATAELEEVMRFGSAFGLTVTTKDGLIDHNMRTVVIDPAGRVQHVFKDGDWTPSELVWEMQKAQRMKP